MRIFEHISSLAPPNSGKKTVGRMPVGPQAQELPGIATDQRYGLRNAQGLKQYNHRH